MEKIDKRNHAGKGLVQEPMSFNELLLSIILLVAVILLTGLNRYFGWF